MKVLDNDEWLSINRAFIIFFLPLKAFGVNLLDWAFRRNAPQIPPDTQAVKDAIDSSVVSDAQVPSSSIAAPSAPSVVPSIQVDEVAPEERISDSVRTNVDRLLDSDDLQAIQYFLIRLFRDLYGVVASADKSSSFLSKDGIKVMVPGTFRSPNSQSKIILDSLADKNLKAEFVDQRTISVGKLRITFDSYIQWGVGIVVTPSRAPTKSDFEQLRLFVETRFLPEFQVNESSAMTPESIGKFLNLPDDAYVALDDKHIEVRFSLENASPVTQESLRTIVSRLNEEIDGYSVKFSGRSYRDCWLVTMSRLRSDLDYSLEIYPSDSALRIKIAPAGYSNSFMLNKDFIQGPIALFLRTIRESVAAKKGYLDRIREYGVLVYDPETEEASPGLDALYAREWFVGYEDVKSIVATNVIHPWSAREAYVEASTREFPNVRNVIPNAALFEGPPGTGKTTCAKIIGLHLGLPFVYVPVAKIMSKWYGEAEQRLDAIFTLAGKAGEEAWGIVVMIDEIDEIGRNRDESHEASGRITGVLLKKLDWMEKIGNLLLIGSTNRKDSMDPALLSRFSQKVFFRNPVSSEVRKIFSHYLPAAASLEDSDFDGLAGMSGRDLRNLSEDLAREYLRRKVVEGGEPDIRTVIAEFLASRKSDKV